MSDTIEVTVISWRDIPAQVTAGRGSSKVKIELPPRFQNAIDRAAMHAGLIGTDDYLSAWTRASKAVEASDADEALQTVVEELEHTFNPEVLHQITTNGGTREAPE